MVIFLSLILNVIVNYNILYNEINDQNCCNAQLIQIGTIGDNLDLGNEYLFRDPQQIKTDTDGNIFITDRNSSVIKVFDKNFRFLKSIGNIGQGPGEFQEITNFEIDNKKNIVVFDNLSQRFTTYYSASDYTEFKSFNIDYEYGIFNTAHLFNNNGNLVINTLNNNVSNGKNLNFITLNENQIINDFLINGEEIADISEPFEHATVLLSLFNFELIESELWLSPKYYNGSLFRFNLDTKKLDEYFGRAPTHPPYKYVSDNYINLPRNNMSIYNGIAGRFITKIYNRSVGLFYHNGEIIEFVFMDNDISLSKNDITFGINRYTLDGRHIQYHVIEQFSSDKSGRFF